MAEQRSLAPLIEVRILSLQIYRVVQWSEQRFPKPLIWVQVLSRLLFFILIFFGFLMSKIIKSYYKLITNFQDDLKGSFLGKLKRRQRTLNLLA